MHTETKATLHELAETKPDRPTSYAVLDSLVGISLHTPVVRVCSIDFCCSYAECTGSIGESDRLKDSFFFLWWKRNLSDAVLLPNHATGQDIMNLEYT